MITSIPISKTPGFLPTTHGVAEHQAKLASVIKSARQYKRSLAIAWLDIAKVFTTLSSSVHHSLIQFSLAHYLSLRILSSAGCYSLAIQVLSATISTDEWSTDPVPLRIGVYQGDPLSVVIFLTVINTLSDTLCTRGDLGFSLSHSPTSLSTICCMLMMPVSLAINTPAGCQHLLVMVQRWLEGAQLKAKVPKCCSMVLQASSEKRIRTSLTISGDTIPTAEDDTFKFLGMPVRVSSNNTTARLALQDTPADVGCH